MSDLIDIEALFGPEGLLKKAFPQFESREAQIEMLRDVLNSYENNKVALIEAGTGTGKSLAYLLPAIFWALKKNEPTVISTNTIALQEQLLNKDIPFLLKALNIDIEVVLVKGMNNYLCHRKVDDVAIEKKLLSEKEQKELDKIEECIPNAIEGSRSELPFVPSTETWERIGAEAESCTHVRCPHYKRCFFFKARQTATEAQLLIVNHHLLFADLSARLETGNYDQPCILPSYQRLIIDEAHHIEEVATEYFADRVSRIAITRIMGRLISERGIGKLKALQQKIYEGYPSLQPPKEISTLLDRLEFLLPAEKRNILDKVEETFLTIGKFVQAAQTDEKLRLKENHLNHPLWISEVQPSVQLLVDTIRSWIQSIFGLEKELNHDANLKTKCEGVLADINALCIRLEDQMAALLSFVFDPETTSRVRWIEGSAFNWQLISAELNISQLLSEALFSKLSTVILCSATLAANKDFRFIKKNLGIEDSLEKIYPSPFDYPAQALLTVPIDMPDPDQSTFMNQASKAIRSIIEISKGSTFVLFTSYAMLKACEERLSHDLKENGFPLLVQGEESRQVLLDRFRQQKGSVLFGTDSFWEGVDVAGDALRCVVIAKLPFKVPSDPLFQARSEVILQEGGSPFFDYSLPHAIMKFKQGFGRLIRSRTDRGCVVCLDSRLIKKGYGKMFLKSLPQCANHFETQEKIFEKMAEFFKLR